VQLRSNPTVGLALPKVFAPEKLVVANIVDFDGYFAVPQIGMGRNELKQVLPVLLGTEFFI